MSPVPAASRRSDRRSGPGALGPRAQLAIPAELSILCGLAIGYPDPDFAANKLHVGREPIGKNVVFLDT
jgi:hypothetical protein